MRIFFSAGEASGDAYAAALVQVMRILESDYYERLFRVDTSQVWDRVKQWLPTDYKPSNAEFKRTEEILDELEPRERERIVKMIGEVGATYKSWGHLNFQGIGGPKLAAAGANIVCDSSRWGAISILQSLKVAPKVIGGYSRAKYALRHGVPGLFIPIDFGYINVKLARYAKSKGWKVLYFIPPGSWRRDKQGKDLAGVAHEIVTPFPWSAEILSGMGANVHFFGHPLKQLIRMEGRKAGGMEGHKDGTLDEDRSTLPSFHPSKLAVLPGSRMHEIKENLPAIAQALATKPSESHIEFAVASSLKVDELRTRWSALAPDRTADLFTQGDTYSVLQRARAAIVCSGTATLEAAFCRCPMVVMYRFGKMTELEIRLRGARPKFISLPNILLEREVVPELIQQDATPEAIRETVSRLLADGPERQAQLDAFEEIDAMLGPSDAITKTAELALKMLG